MENLNASLVVAECIKFDGISIGPGLISIEKHDDGKMVIDLHVIAKNIEFSDEGILNIITKD